MEELLKQLVADIKEIKEDIREIKTKQETFSTLLQDHLRLKTTVNEIKKQQYSINTELNTIKRELNYIKQERLANNIVITGIAKTPGENIHDLVSKMQVNLKLNISPESYRVERLVNAEKKGNSILIKFNENKNKIEFMKKSEDIGIFLQQLGFPHDKDHKIYLQHHLTKENFKIIKYLRKLKKEGAIQYVWFQNNSVLVKKSETSKTIQVKTDLDIEQFNVKSQPENLSKNNKQNPEIAINLLESAELCDSPAKRFKTSSSPRSTRSQKNRNTQESK